MAPSKPVPKSPHAGAHISAKSPRGKVPKSPRGGAQTAHDKIEDELITLRIENDELRLRLDLGESTAPRRGLKRCCVLGFLMALAILLLVVPLPLLHGAVNQKLPSWAQSRANWLLSKVPEAAVEVASVILQDAPSEGQKMALAGAAKKHPVVFVPGFTSTALELWRTDEPCGAHLPPRSRIYSGPAMKMLASNVRCWLGHMGLNASTWRDKASVKVRAASGLGAADYFDVAGLNFEQTFLWGKVRWIRFRTRCHRVFMLLVCRCHSVACLVAVPNSDHPRAWCPGLR